MADRFVFQSPLGWITLEWSPAGVSRLVLTREAPGDGVSQIPAAVQEIRDRLETFFAGKGHHFRDIAVDLSGVPPFHCSVLKALRDIPSGQVITYGQLALLAGRPGAARAVGQAMARNPIPIILPCHRVVASNGPGGFSLFGSLDAKEELLRLDRAPAIL